MGLKTLDELVQEFRDFDIEFSNQSGMLLAEKAIIDGKAGLCLTFWSIASHCRACYPEGKLFQGFPVQYKYDIDSPIDWTLGEHNSHKPAL